MARALRGILKVTGRYQEQLQASDSMRGCEALDRKDRRQARCEIDRKAE
jgi:hypothetical protein